MAERIHPDDPGFRDRWSFRLRRGWVPWVSRIRSPYRREFFWRYQWVNRFCQGQKVLEVPCGMGWGSSLLQGYQSLVAMDLSPEAIEEAVLRYQNRILFIVGDMARLPVADHSLNLVVCLEGIEHVPYETGQQFLVEADRVLKPGGRLLLSSPHCLDRPHSGNPYHLHEYRPQELKALLEPNFKIERTIFRKVENNIIVSYLETLRKSG